MRLALSKDALKTYGTPAAIGDVADAPGQPERVVFTLDHARPGDEQQRAVADRQPADSDRPGHRYPATVAVA